MNELRSALAEELRQAIRVNKMNAELLEVLSGNLRWLVRYAERSGIQLPEIERVEMLLNRAVQMLEAISPDTQRPSKSPDDARAPEE